MAFRKIALCLMVVALGVAACGGDEDEGAFGSDGGGEAPIGAPPPGSDYVPASGPAGSSASSSSGSTEPAVAKTATMQMDVASSKLNPAAQDVVDVATDPKVGGFLVSSDIDLEGDGLGRVFVKVPSDRFEGVVSELGDIGKVTRQHLEGQDLTPDAVDIQIRLRQTGKAVATLRDERQDTEDPAKRFALSDKLRAATSELHQLRSDQKSLASQTAYSSIEVTLVGTPPPAPPEEPALGRSLETARSIALTVLSGIVLAAGVVVPIGLLLLVLYLIGMVVLRRLKLDG